MMSFEINMLDSGASKRRLALGNLFSVFFNDPTRETLRKELRDMLVMSLQRLHYNQEFLALFSEFLSLFNYQ
jgi:hypothetical protein